MFDPSTTAFLADAPALKDVAAESLATILTRAYAWLSTFRLQLSEGNPASITDAAQIDQLRRLANTYEALALELPANDRRRPPAAFVAATAHQLLYQASGYGMYPIRQTGRLSERTVSPDVSAMLLFLIAGYPSDAAETSKHLTLPEPGDALQTIERCIILLARGHHKRVRSSVNRADLRTHQSIEEEATTALYNRLAYGVRGLSVALLGENPNLDTEAPVPDRVFREVRDASVLTKHRPGSPESPSVSVFSGPYHLARLLIAAGEGLLETAVVSVPPPRGTDAVRWRKYLQRLAHSRPYIWKNHREAITSGYLESGVSSVIAFPTGSGKSTLAELKIAAAIEEGDAVVYLAPTHALVGQVARDLSKSFKSANVLESLAHEVAYTEIDQQAAADIAVMTPERCLTLLNVAPETFAKVKLVVFDECHLLHGNGRDDDRRSLDAMLCLLGLFDKAPDADFVLLSAMIGNTEEVAGWISKVTERPCVPLTLDWKPTRQARGCIVFTEDDVRRAEEALEETRVLKQAVNRLPKEDVKGRRAANKVIRSIKSRTVATPQVLVGLTHNWPAMITPEQYALFPVLDRPVSIVKMGKRPTIKSHTNAVAATLAAHLANLNIKTIIFLHERRLCNSVVRKVLENISGPVSGPPTQDDLALFEAILQEVGDRDCALATPESLVAEHHGLLLPQERALVESRFRNEAGSKVLVATGTLAQGMNLPAQAVIIAGTERFEEGDGVSVAKGRRAVGAEELLNAAGRAGRAGLQAAGTVLLVPDTLISVDNTLQPTSGPWRRLQQSLFSKRDQCLAIVDPIESILDRIQSSDATYSRNIRYFLNRLPALPSTTAETEFGDEADLDVSPTASMLGKSLAAYHAEQRGTSPKFANTVRTVISRQRALSAMIELRPDLAWLDAVAWRLGMPPDRVRAIGSALARRPIPQDVTVTRCVQWMFSWFTDDPTILPELLPERSLFAALADDEKISYQSGEMSIAQFAALTQARLNLWLQGKSLTEIQSSLASDSPGDCLKARQFAIYLTRDLSYLAGAITLVRREQLKQHWLDDPLALPTVPLALGVFASCIREGAETPEILAVRLTLRDRGSRIQARRIALEYVHEFGHSTVGETFPEMRLRIGMAMKDLGLTQH